MHRVNYTVSTPVYTYILVTYRIRQIKNKSIWDEYLNLNIQFGWVCTCLQTISIRRVWCTSTERMSHGDLYDEI